MLSKMYDYPPIVILRAILSAKGHSKKEIKKMMADKNLLDTKDKQQFELAIEHDIISNPDNASQKEHACQFEDVLELFFEEKDVKFKTEADLIEEQTKLTGAPFATPDLYFPQGVRINGKILYWIDAKSYYGGNVSYIRASINKQSKKYQQYFGDGAFIFKHGYSEDLKSESMLIGFPETMFNRLEKKIAK